MSHAACAQKGGGNGGNEICDSLEKLTADYLTYSVSSVRTKDQISVEKVTDEDCRTLSTDASCEICCNLVEFEINESCSIVFEVNHEGQSVVKACTGYHSHVQGSVGPEAGDVLVGVGEVAVIDSYYAESLLDDRHRDAVTLRFMRGDQTPKTLSEVPLGGAPPKRARKNGEEKKDDRKETGGGKDLEYFRHEFHLLAAKAFEKGMYKWALQSACKVLSICKMLTDCHHELLACHDLMGSIYDKLDLHSKSLGHLQIALSVAQVCSLNVVEIVDLRQRMGKACRHLKEYELAIDHYNAALQTIQKHMEALSNVGRDDNSCLAWIAAREALISTYVALGKAYRLQGDHLHLALASERSALLHLRALGCPNGCIFNEADKILCRVNICLVLGLEGDLSVENETEMIMAVKTLERGSYSTSVKASSIYRAVSNFFELRRDWERAIIYRLHEIKLREMGDAASATLASALWRISVYYRYAGKDKKSFDFREKTIAMMTSLYGRDSKRLEKYLISHQRHCEADRCRGAGGGVTEEESVSGADSDPETMAGEYYDSSKQI